MTVPFENDTGNIVRKLARKSLKSEKRRNLMVVIAVALASCLICFSIVMALSTRQIEKNHVEDTYEAVYTRITEEDVSTLKGLDDFSRVMMYGAQNGITVKSNSDSELGMRLVAYLPELHCAVDIAGATVTEKREQSVKAHICQSNRLSYYLIKRTTDTSQMAAEIKTLFIRNHIYLHTDSEHDVQVLRERFLEWKNRNVCELNGKY